MGIELPYDKKSIYQIADFIGLSVEQTMEKYYGKISKDGNSLIFDSKKRKPCPFLINDNDDKMSCLIHSVKPEGCKLFPFESMGTLDCPEARMIIKKIQEEDKNN